MATTGRRSSAIWTQFTDLGDGYASCNVCKNVVSYKTSITNLKRHFYRGDHSKFLRNKHLKARLENGKQPSTSNTGSPKESQPSGSSPSSTAASNAPGKSTRLSRYRCRPATGAFPLRRIDPNQKKKIDEALMNMFIVDLQPFSVVEDDGFVEYTRALNSLYQLPTRNYLSDAKLTTLYQKCHREVRTKVVQEAKSACFTLYTWTSKAGDSYLAVMAHFLGDAFDFNSVLIECSTFSAPYTVQNFAATLRRIAFEWELEGKVTLVVSDDDAVVKAAVVHELKWFHMVCYSRTLNSIVQRALHRKELRKTLEKIRVVVSYFLGYPEANDELMRQQHGVDSPKTLIEDDPTRWETTLLMIQRFSLLVDAINAAVEERGAKDLPYLSHDEWETCSQMGTVLQPFEEVSAQMGRDQYTTASQIFVMTRGLMSLCHRLAASDAYNGKVRAVLSELWQDLKEQFLSVEQREGVAVSTMLDPRFKAHAFPADLEGQTTRMETIEQVTAMVREEYEKSGEQESGEQEEASVSECGNLSAWEDFDSIVEEVQPRETPVGMAEKEVQRFLEDKLLGRNEDPFQWWQKHQHIYPNLAKMVPYKCNMLATSIPCERVFSKIQNIIDLRGADHDSRELHQLLFLKTNMSFMPTL